MPHPLFMFRPYVWPYSPRPAFGILMAAALIIQILFAHNIPRLRPLLPIFGGLILIAAIPAGHLIPPQDGVFLGELYTMFAVAIPGAAILFGSALGSVFYWLYENLK